MHMLPSASPGREALDVKHFKPQALAALCKAAEQQSQELTLPPALPVHLRPPPPPPGAGNCNFSSVFEGEGLRATGSVQH